MAINVDRPKVDPGGKPVLTSCLRFKKQTKKVILEASRASIRNSFSRDGTKGHSKDDLLGNVLGKGTIHILVDDKAKIGYRVIGQVFLLENNDYFDS